MYKTDVKITQIVNILFSALVFDCYFINNDSLGDLFRYKA